MKPSFIGTLIAISLFFSPFSNGMEIRIASNSLIFDSFMKWSKEQPCQDITNFDHPLANRGTVELILICQAFDRMDFPVMLRIKKYPNYQRALTEATRGNVHMPAETLWQQSIDKQDFYATDPIIQDGEFEKGLYTLPSNHKALRANNLSDLQTLKAVMPKSWFIDWDTLQAMGVKTFSAPHKESMFRMINAKHVDFTLLEFSSASDMNNQHDGITLIPIPNLKVGLRGSRHLVLSKHAPNARKLYEVLNQGIKRLRKDGTITKAFEQSGFFNPRVQKWKKAF